MAKLIRDWEELAKEESEKYRIKLEPSGYCGHIVPKVETEETQEDYFKHHHYLSTHTFYEGQHKYSTMILRSYGFDVELESWG